MSGRSVLVSGAGVAGLACAYWLRRAGFEVCVVERGSALRDGGQAVDIRGTAVEVVEKMGLIEAVRAERTNIRGMSFMAGDGTELATLDSAFGVVDPDDVEIVRGDLCRILREALDSGVEFVFGDSVSALREQQDGVVVEFERSPARAFDLVVGADGLHSTVRELAFGAESQFRRDLGAYVATYTIPNYLELDHWQLGHGSAGRTAAIISARGNAEARAFFLFASPPLRYDYRDRAAQQRLLTEALDGMGWEVPRLLVELPGAPDFYFDSISQIELPHWSTGRVVLVGDSGYCGSPMSGQGTSMALIGAYVLAGELAGQAEHTAAFDRYERGLREFVTRNQGIAQDAITQSLPRSDKQVRQQARAIRALGHLPGRNLLFRLMTRSIRRISRSLDLPDYPLSPSLALTQS